MFDISDYIGDIDDTDEIDWYQLFQQKKKN